jgi:hypothetical protein
MWRDFLFDAGQNLIDRRLRKNLGGSQRRYLLLSLGYIWMPALLLAALCRPMLLDCYFGAFRWGLGLALLVYHLRAGTGCIALSPRHLPLLLINGLRLTALPLLLMPGGWRVLAALLPLIALGSLVVRWSPPRWPRPGRLYVFDNPILARECPGPFLVLYHFALGLSGLLFWLRLQPTKGCCGPAGTFEFWLGFGLLNLFILARSGTWTLSKLLQERRQGTLDALEHAVACPRSFARGWALAACLHYGAESLCILAVLVLAALSPEGAAIMGRRHPSAFILFGLVAVGALLTALMPSLGAWQAQLACRRSQTSTEAWKLLAARPVMGFFLWSLCVPLLGVDSTFPLLPLLLALLFVRLLAWLPLSEVRTCPILCLVGAGTGLALAFDTTGGEWAWGLHPVALLWGAMASAGVARFWPGPKGSCRSVLQAFALALRGGAVSAVAVLSCLWLVSLDLEGSVDLSLVAMALDYAVPFILFGALLAGMAGGLQLAQRRPSLVLGSFMILIPPLLAVCSPQDPLEGPIGTRRLLLDGISLGESAPAVVSRLGPRAECSPELPYRCARRVVLRGDLQVELEDDAVTRVGPAWSSFRLHDGDVEIARDGATWGSLLRSFPGAYRELVYAYPSHETFRLRVDGKTVLRVEIAKRWYLDERSWPLQSLELEAYPGDRAWKSRGEI